MLEILAAVFISAMTQAGGQKEVRMPPEIRHVQPLGEEKRVQADDIDKVLASGKVVLLDVREAWELEELGTREGYIHIPIAELESRLNELPKDKSILTA
jgi:predicted sulfurtransferase